MFLASKYSLRLAYGTPTNMASYIKKSLQAKKSLRATLKSHPVDLYDKETVEKWTWTLFCTSTTQNLYIVAYKILALCFLVVGAVTFQPSYIILEITIYRYHITICIGSPEAAYPWSWLIWSQFPLSVSIFHICVWLSHWAERIFLYELWIIINLDCQ